MLWDCAYKRNQEWHYSLRMCSSGACTVLKVRSVCMREVTCRQIIKLCAYSAWGVRQCTAHPHTDHKYTYTHLHSLNATIDTRSYMWWLSVKCLWCNHVHSVRQCCCYMLGLYSCFRVFSPDCTLHSAIILAIKVFSREFRWRNHAWASAVLILISREWSQCAMCAIGTKTPEKSVSWPYCTC